MLIATRDFVASTGRGAAGTVEGMKTKSTVKAGLYAPSGNSGTNPL